jgi:hypothetical protein
MVVILVTSYIRGLGPFWQKTYAEYGDFLNMNCIQTKVFIVNHVARRAVNMYHHVAYITDHNKAS